MPVKETHEEFDEAEAARRRDEVIKRMLATPPQPHKPKRERESKPKPEDRGSD